jgi:hypothetical protein
MRALAIAMIISQIACAAQAADRAALIAAIHDACVGDKDRLCGDVENGAVGRCFKEHWSEVSPTCRAVIKSAREAVRREVSLPAKSI